MNSWLYRDLKNRICVEIDELSFLFEVNGFLFDTFFLKEHLNKIDLETLQFSRIVDGVEEAYHPIKDEYIVSGSPVYYSEDNCFIIYYSLTD